MNEKFHGSSSWPKKIINMQEKFNEIALTAYFENACQIILFRRDTVFKLLFVF